MEPVTLVWSTAGEIQIYFTLINGKTVSKIKLTSDKITILYSTGSVHIAPMHNPTIRKNCRPVLYDQYKLFITFKVHFSENVSNMLQGGFWASCHMYIYKKKKKAMFTYLHACYYVSLPIFHLIRLI